MKQAILMVSFGTSYDETRAKTIEAIEAAAKKEFPEYEIRRAFTSKTIMGILKKRGIFVDDVTQALARLKEEGYQKVLCQPTHIMHGYEYDDIVNAASAFAGEFESFAIGVPLLSSPEDYKQAAQSLGFLVPVEQGTALVWMGHGTEHPANATYSALEYAFHDAGYKNVFVGTVEGYPDLQAVMRRLKEYGAEKVLLAPFMVVAGDHAMNDMAGDEEDSWNSQLKAQGWQTEILLKGLGEYKEIRRQYMGHIHSALEKMQ